VAVSDVARGGKIGSEEARDLNDRPCPATQRSGWPGTRWVFRLKAAFNPVDQPLAPLRYGDARALRLSMSSFFATIIDGSGRIPGPGGQHEPVAVESVIPGRGIEQVVQSRHGASPPEASVTTSRAGHACLGSQLRGVDRPHGLVIRHEVSRVG
jgi:hypothetical protein